jgi:hypothetical protein
VAGSEIVVQMVHRIEADYLLVRGRQTGLTTEGGGFFFLPYDRILFMSFQRPVKETLIRSIFGELPAGAAVREEPAKLPPEPEPAIPTEAQTPEPTADAAPAVVETSPAAPPAPEPSKPSLANKAELLERLRARRSETGPVSS